MINRLAKAATKHLLLAATAVAFVPTLTAPLRAQQGTYQSRQTPAITRDMRYREWELKDFEKNGKKPLTKEDQQLAWIQIREDFRQIQVSHNNLLRTVAANSVLDHKVISSAAAEINKRARRLKSNLSFPEAEPRQTTWHEGLQMRTMLSALGGLIIRFVKNPVFEDTGVVDAKDSAQAGRDLQRIIQFSDRIRRSSEEWAKSQESK